MINEDLKHRIVKALKERRENFGGSDAKYARSLEIAPAQWSRIKNGDLEKVLSDAKWITLARLMNVQLKKQVAWRTAKTPVFEYITTQLQKCQQESISLLLCDIADIGKTYTARIYSQMNKNAVYVDCSQVKTKQKLVRYIAQQFGVGHTGRYNSVYADLTYYLNSIENPLVILDEAGDLNYEAFLEIKALWNATERACGWFMMGADGLKEKIRRSIDYKKVGYTEIFSRYGSKYQRVTPDGAEERKRFNTTQAALIIKANTDNAIDIQKMIKSSGGSLRRIYNELIKQRA